MNLTLGTRHGAWLSLLRLAFRNLARHRGRTVLICVLIGLPVAAAVAADILFLTHAPTPAAFVREELGSADAKISDTSTTRIVGDITARYGGYTSVGTEKSRAPLTPAQVKALLPVGSSMAHPCATSSGGAGTSGLATSGDSAVAVQISVCEPGSVGATQLKLRSGRLPTDAAEVAVTSAVAKRLGLTDLGRLRSGSTLTVDGGPAAPVVGIADERSYTATEALYVASGNVAITPAPANTWLVTFPPAIRDDPAAISAAAAVLFDSGMDGNFRDPILHPDRYASSTTTSDDSNLQALLLGAVFVAFGLVEVVLLAGAAMSVGIRRQAREIGLLGAIGGDRRDIRRLVLMQTLAYSVTGSVLAVPVGLLAVVVSRPITERLASRDMSDLGLAPLHWLALAAFGLLGGIVAGWWPSRGIAKLPAVDALAGRLGDARMAVRVPTRRFVVAGLGIATSLVAAAWLFTAVRSIDTAQNSSVVVPVLVLIAGIITTTLALASLMSPLLGLIGRRVGRLPLAARFAVRDLGRQRARTAPAAAAVMVAVAAALGISFVLAGTDAHNRRIYEPWLPVGDISLYAAGGPDNLAQVTTAAQAAIPASRIVSMPTITSTVKYQEPDEGYVSPLVAALPSRLQFDPNAGESYQFALGDSDFLHHIMPTEADRILALLAQGRAVLLTDNTSVSSVGLVRAPNDAVDSLSGKVTGAFDRTIQVTRMRPPSTSSLLPGGTVLISSAMMSDLGLRPETGTTLLVPPGPIDAATADQVSAKVEQVGGSAHAELGYTSRLPATMLIAAGIAGFLAIAATVISLALVQSEGRADLATLAAVGADPSRRRLITFWQALAIAVVGGVTGTLLGGFVAFASRPLAGYVAVPWLPVLLVTVVLPIVSAGLATAFTRSRLPMVRRLT